MGLPAIPDSLTTMERTVALFTKFGGSGLLPDSVRTPTDAAIIAGMATSLGRDPMWGFRNIHVIKGKPNLSASAMLALAMEHPDCEYIMPTCLSAERVAYRAKRRSWPEPVEMEFTADDARRAGLTSDIWRKYPQAMLGARCISALVRACFPDATAGVYESSSGELTGGEPVTGTSVVDAIFVEGPNAQEPRSAPQRPGHDAGPPPTPERGTAGKPGRLTATGDEFVRACRAAAVAPGDVDRFRSWASGKSSLEAPEAGFSRGGLLALLTVPVLRSALDAANDADDPAAAVDHIGAALAVKDEAHPALDGLTADPGTPTLWNAVKAALRALAEGGAS